VIGSTCSWSWLLFVVHFLVLYLVWSCIFYPLTNLFGFFLKNFEHLITLREKTGRMSYSLKSGLQDSTRFSVFAPCQSTN
jgi:hypothetical protein